MFSNTTNRPLVTRLGNGLCVWAVISCSVTILATHPDKVVYEGVVDVQLRVGVEQSQVLGGVRSQLLKPLPF